MLIDRSLFRTVGRRQLLARSGAGFGILGLSSLLGQAQAAQKPARAKHVIHIFLNGGLSHVDTFDPKPTLDKYDGKPYPGGDLKTERKTGALMRSPFSFSRHGQSGLPVSELFPHLAKLIDQICVVRSMTTLIPNHEPSLLMMNTGHVQTGRPAMGSWLTYGLGSENQNLPGFIVLSPGAPVVGAPLWGSAFLPSSHQGTLIGTNAKDPRDAIAYLKSPNSGQHQSEQLALARALDEARATTSGGDPQLDAHIKSMEVAFRMQSEAPEAFDLSREDPRTLALYGEGAFARSCLLARRLVERGVRAVQVYFDKGNPWDHHDDIFLHRRHARTSDQPIAALLTDLGRRGLLDETVVVIGSEFGRTPVVEVGQGGPGGIRSASGRDHNPFGFTVLLAGAGIKGGQAHGATDEFGFKAVKDVMDVHDLHATLLHLFGIDHTRLTYRFAGRDYRLSDVAGRVIGGLLNDGHAG